MFGSADFVYMVVDATGGKNLYCENCLPDKSIPCHARMKSSMKS